MDKELIINNESIKNKIHYIRGKYVMLDRDLAKLYEVKTRRLREQVKRNIERFPDDFMFQINLNEYKLMVSQNATPSIQQLGGHLPYVFTEQGVAMLSSVLKNKKAIEVNIQIIRAFISMRKFLIQNSYLFQKMDNFEIKLLEHDKKIDVLFNKIQESDIPKQGVFFNGQIFDAYHFVSKLIKKAKNEIILIDNYIDEEILQIFTKTNVKVKILTKNILNLDIKKVNLQYKNIEIKIFNLSHDRFIIIDKEIYLIGSSLKDLGKRLFAFSKIEDENSINKIHKFIHK